jgi:hypothetical protein
MAKRKVPGSKPSLVGSINLQVRCATPRCPGGEMPTVRISLLRYLQTNELRCPDCDQPLPLEG